MESAATTELRAAARAARPLASTWVAVGLWMGLIAVGYAWGTALNGAGSTMELGAPPLLGRWDLRMGWGVLLPLAAATAIVIAAPRLSRSASWRALLSYAALGAALWAGALALSHGPGGITQPVLDPNEYLSDVDLIGSPGEFLSTFTDGLGGFTYTTHVRSHPPGMLLGLWGLDAVGLGGPWPAAVAILAIAASAVPAALISLRALAGEDAARRASPYLVLVPAAVWIATSADALFMGVGAWAVAATVLSLTVEGRRSDLLALAGGVLFGVCVFLSYGLLLLAVVPLTVAASTRRVRPLAIAAAGAAALAVGFLAAGFWWLDGFFAVREQYLESVAQNRPYDYFLVNNLAAFALAAGPVAMIALARLRDPAVWLLVGGSVAAIAAADLSGMSKGEVERIWLPFLPWLMLATSALPAGRGTTRALLATQAACGVVIQLGVRTVW
jgi:methylthioxylose transferase